MTIKKNGPLSPIVRKGGKNSDETPEEGVAAQEAPQADATAPPTPEPKVEALPEPAPELKLSRRVVDPNVAPDKPKRKEVVIETVVEQGSLADFEALLAGSNIDEKRVSFDVGDQVEGTVVKIGERYLYLELAGRSEAMANRAEYTDKHGELEVAEGDTVQAYVVDKRSGIQVGKKLGSKSSAADALELAFSSGAPVEGRVTATNKGGYDVEIQGLRTFCPVSQIELQFTEDADVHVNQTYLFRVTKFGEEGRNIVVSRSALLEEERKVAAEKTLATLGEGMTVVGTVTRLADFGAFVDLGGIEGLVHISQLGFSRVDHPSEAVQMGQQVNVKVLSMTESEKGLRIGLSMKETLENPWDSGVSNFVEGQKVSGTVVRVETFGAFVELMPGLEGLIHVSEMSWEKHVKHAQDVVSVGEEVMVEIQSIDPVRQRMSLSIKGAGSDPWSTIEERFGIGLEVEGIVENVEDFGVFVALKDGITALIPRSEINLPREATPHRQFSKGDTVTARVLSIEKDRRRMALSMKSAEELSEAADRANAPRSFTDTSGSGFGTLGDLLKNRNK